MACFEWNLHTKISIRDSVLRTTVCEDHIVDIMFLLHDSLWHHNEHWQFEGCPWWYHNGSCCCYGYIWYYNALISSNNNQFMVYSGDQVNCFCEDISFILWTRELSLHNNSPRSPVNNCIIRLYRIVIVATNLVTMRTKKAHIILQYKKTLLDNKK